MRFLRRLGNIGRRPGFWFILAVLVLITLFHYAEVESYPGIFIHISNSLGLSRHAFDRILYLAPIIWASFIFGWPGAVITSLVALVCMLPRVIFISTTPFDALLETGAVFIIGNVVAISFASLRKEREYRLQLETAQEEIKTSEERYRQLFENAHDAIWLHDFEGNIITANRAAALLTGYTVAELSMMNVKSFLSEDSLKMAHEVREKLLHQEPVQQPYEQHLMKKDGAEGFVQLATSVVLEKGKPVAFQHIARDVTEEKRMQENLRYYLFQITKAQEEERKRISHELHDDTIQALVVLSRRLDSLGTNKKIPEEFRPHVEELWQQTNDVIQGIRRLSQDLRPAALDRLGLLPALEWLAADTSTYSGVKTRVSLVGEERRLPEEVELVLFRITQEALRNVWRHAEATEAEVTLEFNRSETRITIVDNGKGFTPPQKMGDLARDGKLGLAGMQERAQLIGGTVNITSKPGKGSKITIELPL